MSHRSDPAAAFADADILVVPGRGGSCGEHWQSHFERRHANARRVAQDNWDEPELDRWAHRIAVAALQSDRRVLAVAHSFGCLALARAIAEYDADVDAALLVAPAEPERFGIAVATVGIPLRIPSLLIASNNDPWLSSVQAVDLAARWGSRYLNLGLAGHINVASGFGPWPACDGYAETVWREFQACGEHAPVATAAAHRAGRRVAAGLNPAT